MREGTTISIYWRAKAKQNGCWLQAMGTSKENLNPRDSKAQTKAFQKKTN